MRDLTRALIVVVAAVATTSCYRLIPAAKAPYAITGVVESIDATTLSLRHKSGQRLRIALAPATTVSRRDSPAAVSDIAVGMRIVVVYRIVDGMAVADEVHLFRPPIMSPARSRLLLS